MRKTQGDFLTVVVSAVFVLGLMASGCSPEMRKKFIRERKSGTGQNTVMPVLEPVEYPDALETAKMRYDYFFALLKVWQKDALMLIDDGASDRQIRYALGQIKLQLQELEKLFDDESRTTAQEGIQKVDDILAQYDQPASLRNAGMVRRDVERLRETVIKPLSSETALRHFK